MGANYRPEQQMGPAFLPTPLSPARGCSDFGAASGEPSTLLVSAHTWRPMSGLARPVLRPGYARFRHRRSRRHPAFAPALPRPLKAQGLRCPPPCAGAWPRPRSFTGSSTSGLGAFAVPLAFHSGQVPGLSGDTASRPPQTRPLAFGRSLLHAVSQQVRGQMSPPSLG